MDGDKRDGGAVGSGRQRGGGSARRRGAVRASGLAVRLADRRAGPGGTVRDSSACSEDGAGERSDVGLPLAAEAERPEAAAASDGAGGARGCPICGSLEHRGCSMYGSARDSSTPWTGPYDWRQAAQAEIGVMCEECGVWSWSAFDGKVYCGACGRLRWTVGSGRQPVPMAARIGAALRHWLLRHPRLSRLRWWQVRALLGEDTPRWRLWLAVMSGRMDRWLARAWARIDGWLQAVGLWRVRR